MIGRRGKALIFLYVVFLAVLFLMCSTDMIIREPEKEIYQIAVIIEDVRSDNYSNFRKGMDQAAMEFNIDIHFITLYEKLDADQQMEFMDREQQDGADALIVVPADEERVARKQMGVPVILLSSGPAERTGAGSVIVDYEKMGEMLAHEAMQDISEDSTVLMLTDPAKQSMRDRLFVKGADAVFTAGGHKIQTVHKDGENGFRESLKKVELRTGEKAVLLAENQDILAEAAGILTDEPMTAEWVEGLYGRGNTMAVLNYLEHGEITGICVTDDFGMGYLSVRAAVQALDGVESLSVVMEPCYIEKSNLWEPACAELLFPIE